MECAFIKQLERITANLLNIPVLCFRLILLDDLPENVPLGSPQKNLEHEICLKGRFKTI